MEAVGEVMGVYMNLGSLDSDGCHESEHVRSTCTCNMKKEVSYERCTVLKKCTTVLCSIMCWKRRRRGQKLWLEYLFHTEGKYD